MTCWNTSNVINRLTYIIGRYEYKGGNIGVGFTECVIEIHRVNGSSHQKILVTLGRFDTEAGEKRLGKLAKAFVEASERLSLINLAKDLKLLKSREYGPILTFKRIWKELGLGKVLCPSPFFHAVHLLSKYDNIITL